MNTTFNYYELLGVSENASSEEIKEAYKKQMKKWHPDINKSSDAVNMSAKINEAKEVLLDDLKRKDYDQYLKDKINENYNRYTQRKANSTNTNNTNNVYEDVKVTKWQYLKDWLKYATVSKLRKLIGLIGVLIESFFCWLIKIILIITAYICTIGSSIIRMIYGYIAPILGILGVLFIVMCFVNGFNETINDNPGSLTAIIVIVLVYVLSFILPVLAKSILSVKVFDILYNKIDINLFKKCVGYKD